MELSKEIELRWIEVLSGHVTEKRWGLIQKVVKERTRHVTIVLEDIYQAHNAGAVVRSCDGFGVQDVHVIEKRNKMDFDKTSVSKGAKKWLDFHHYDNTKKCIDILHDQGYAVGAMTLGKESVRLEEIPLDKPIAIMIGTEMKGLSEEACEMADFCIELPMYGFTQSYNLSVCAALSMNILTSRLRQSEINWKLSEDAQRKLTLDWLQRCVNNWDKLVKANEHQPT